MKTLRHDVIGVGVYADSARSSRCCDGHVDVINQMAKILWSENDAVKYIFGWLNFHD